MGLVLFNFTYLTVDEIKYQEMLARKELLEIQLFSVFIPTIKTSEKLKE